MSLRPSNIKKDIGYYVNQSNSNRVLMLLRRDIHYLRERQLLQPEDSKIIGTVQLVLQVIVGLPEIVTRLFQKG